MPDLPDWSQSVSIDAASVTITVSGAVTIASGSVTIANASIAVINATGTKITSARPPQLLGTVSNNPNPNTGNFALPADVQALVLVNNYFGFTLSDLTHLKVTYHDAAFPAFVSWVPFEIFSAGQAVYAFPVLPSAPKDDGGQNPTIDVLIQAAALNSWRVDVWAIFESAPLWLEVFPLPQLDPNQLPSLISMGLATAGTWYPIIAPIANVQISLFQIGLLGFEGIPTSGGENFRLGYGPDATHVTPFADFDVANSSGTSGLVSGQIPILPFSGAQLPRGNGLFVLKESVVATINVKGFVNYSLS